MDGFNELKDFVISRRTDLKWRLGQLELLRKLLLEEEESIYKALKQDLHIDTAEATVFQFCPLMLDFDCYDRQMLESYMMPEKRSTPLALQPASCYVRAEPKGVVLIIGPWNYPFNLIFNPLITAIAAGNCAVLKPSELAPESAKLIQRICDRMDQRAIRCVQGDGVFASALVENFAWDHIVYTGGPRVAKMVMASAAKNLIPVTMELGGKSPCIICDGINLDEACQRIVTMKFVNVGQTCIAPDVVFLERGAKEKVLQTLKRIIIERFSAHPEACEDYSRLVNASSAKRLLDALREEHGGMIFMGGADTPGGETFYADRYIAPTIVVDPRPGCKLMEEEIFGPILVVITVNSYEDAIEFLRSRPKPLALYPFGSRAQVEDIIARTSSGGVVVNDCGMHRGNPDIPFGGIGNSGMGMLSGPHGFRELSHLKSVMYRPLFAPSLIKHPAINFMLPVIRFYATSHVEIRVRRHLWKVIAVVVAFSAIFLRRRH